MRKITIIILMTALFVIMLSGCSGLRGNSRSFRMENETNYLVDMSMPIEPDKASSATAIFQKQLKSQNIILAGEVPGVSGNADLEKYFFEAFNNYNKVDYIIAEIPYSAGELLNDYFEESSEDSLNKAFSILTGRPYATEENRSLYRQLKLYLKSRNETVKIVGIDLEYEPEMTLEYLARQIQFKNLEEYPVAKELVDARNQGFLQADYLEITLMKLLNELREDPVRGANVFGGDLKAIIHVLENLEMTYNREKTNTNEQFNHERSDQLVRNFLAVYDLAPDAFYFGQLANPAVMQAEHMDYNWFASEIQNQRKEIKGKVISLLYTYEDCQRMIQLAGKDEKENLDLFKFDDRKMNNAVNQPFTLISLIDKESMFNEESVIFEKDFTGAVTEYFQYLVVLNESPASKALKVSENE